MKLSNIPVASLRCMALFSAGVLLAADAAHADRNNFRIYTGTECRLRGDDLRSNGHADLGVSQFGFIANISADGDAGTSDSGARDLNVVCPIERRARRSAAGVNVVVRYRDTERDGTNNGTTRFCCELHNARPNTQPLVASFSASPAERDCASLNAAGFGAAEIVLEQSNRDSGNNITNSGEAGGYSLSCLLPPGAQLIDYTVREND